jgi:hypothetical protein
MWKFTYRHFRVKFHFSKFLLYTVLKKMQSLKSPKRISVYSVFLVSLLSNVNISQTAI